MICKIYQQDCEDFLEKYNGIPFDLSFLDPPFNQNKEYASHDDNMASHEYWDWMTRICKLIYEKSSTGASIYFMQREKNIHHVLNALETSGWEFQNLIIWKKKTSAVPSNIRYGKHYQIIAFSAKGKQTRAFNKLRINPPLLVTEHHPRPTGVFVTDVWDDIRELTSGYFAGDEAIRDKTGARFYKQQSPIHLLLRIILSSSNPGDLVLDPFAGTGTTLVVAKQLFRNSIGIEIDPTNVSIIENRISLIRASDIIYKYKDNYKYTENLEKIWSQTLTDHEETPGSQMSFIEIK